MKVVALAGGTGAARFLRGLVAHLPPAQLTVIGNTGDDAEFWGLHVSPDLDIVTYTLAGLVNPETGWGFSSDTFHCLDLLTRYGGGERWFNLGDRDLATHIYRTEMLKKGRTLAEVAERVRTSLGVKSRILPMTDTHVPTTILTDEGPLHFQEYLVKRRAQIAVRGIRFENIESALPAPGVAEAIHAAEAIIICPSNPLISIGPILAVPGLRALLQETKARVAAISPVVGGASLKGPTDRMLAELGMEVSAAQVARLYADILDVYIIDHRDGAAQEEIERLGVKVCVTETVMSGPAEKLALAQAVLKCVS